MRERITIAILALGGQGGGVLADWLVALGDANGWTVQATSVPGVAQRTGSTVYYLELFPMTAEPPVLALMPAPGDVDIVVASELMEAGRAILRGFVTKDRTTLIASTHRIYAISEKSAISGGVADGSKVMDAARGNAKRLIAFDMEEAAGATSSAISAVMLGALAGSGALPFARASFEAAIRDGGIAVEANLKGFAAGFEGREAQPAPAPEIDFVAEGVRRLSDYQDEAYAQLYRERLASVPNGGPELARALALWMSYEDVMRVAQLKVRRARMDKIRDEVRAEPGQIVHVTEYMHPRWQELCDTLPAGLGARLARGGIVKRLFAPLFEKGRHVRTTSVVWFLMLSLLARHRRARRGTLRYAQENARIEAWLAAIREARDVETARELVLSQNLIKGYGDTHARSSAKFEAVMEAWRRGASAPALRALREAAFKEAS